MANIALVVLDTLRKDSFDNHFESLPGRTFDHAWSTSHWTVPSHASLFTGLYASETGVYGQSPEFDFSGDTLAESLSGSGYRCRGFSCNPFITDTFGFTRGFEEMKRNWSSRRLDDDIFDWGDFESERRFEGILRFPEAVYKVLTSECDTRTSLEHGLRRKLYFNNSSLSDGDKGAKQVLRHLRKADFDTDEFFFTNLMEAHGPYRCPPEYQSDVETNDGSSFADVVGFETLRPEGTRQAYDDCVRYLSDVYEEIHAELRESFDYVFTVADHGENLGEDDNWGHNFGVHPAVTNVPFSVWAADGSHEELNPDGPLSLIDLYATVLGRAGVTRPEDRRGVDLFAEPQTEPRLTEFHGISQPEHASRIRERGHDESVVDAYDSWLRGMALPEGYYGYETVYESEHRYRETGPSPVDDPQALLEREHEMLDVREARDAADYSESVREELEHLGYL